jgi:hypothetical protein
VIRVNAAIIGSSSGHTEERNAEAPGQMEGERVEPNRSHGSLVSSR